MDRDKLVFYPFQIVPSLSNMTVIFKRSFRKLIKSQFVVKTDKFYLVFVKLLSELRLSSHTIYVPDTNMAVTLAQFLLFLKNKGK